MLSAIWLHVISYSYSTQGDPESEILQSSLAPVAASNSPVSWKDRIGKDQHSYHDLEKMYAFFVEKGVGLWHIQLANPMGNLAGKKELIMDPQRIPHLTQFIREKSRERKMAVIAADSVGYYAEVPFSISQFSL